MAIDVVVPEVSDGVKSGTVISVAVGIGDLVEEDQTLLELETDKAVVAIPSPQAGKVVEILVAEGDTAKIGAVIARLEGGGGATTAPEVSQQVAAEEAEPGVAKTEPVAAAPIDASQYDSEMVVIGAGPGGYAAAFKAAELGMKVTLVDPEANPGGVCLHRGCIPSKALLHVSKLVNEAEESAEIGVTFATPQIDVERVRAWKNEVIGKLTSGLGGKVQKMKVTYIRGLAKFKDAHTLCVSPVDGNERELSFAQAIIATGSRPNMIPGLSVSDKIIDSTGALELADVPAKLLVIGGGYIGLELGSAYAGMGSEVTVVEMTDGLLPGCDRDLVSVLKRRLDKKFADILLKTKVAKLDETNDGVAVTFEDAKGEQTIRQFDKVLISIGRRPNTENIGLENTRVEVNKRGFVVVDGQQRTAESHIFAIGDIAGDPMLAHKAYGEANVAAEVAAGRKAVFEPRAIPAVVFTDPEVAWCGLTETQAREQKIKIKTAKMPWRGNGRTLTLGREDGMTKLIVDPETDRLLGAAVAGPGAGELIAELVVAMEMAAVSEDLRHSIHPHPTLSETIYEAAEMLFKP